MQVVKRHWDTLLGWCSPDLRSEAWLHSPPESWKVGGVVPHLGDIARFKRSMRLSGGTLNPPDRPRNASLAGDNLYPDADFRERVQNSIRLAQKLLVVQRHSLRHGYGAFRYTREVGVGDLRRISLPNNLLSDLSIRMSYYRHRIFDLETKAPTSSRRYLEIGAGFGALAQYVLNDRRSVHAQYVICDLPEFLPICYWYLHSSGISVCPFGDASTPSSRVVLTTGEHLPHLDGVDVAINTMSFQHMTSTNVGYYLGQIEALKAEVVFLVNRDRKRDPTDVPISQYPRPSNYTIERDHGAWTGGLTHREQVWRRRP